MKGLALDLEKVQEMQNTALPYAFFQQLMKKRAINRKSKDSLKF